LVRAKRGWHALPQGRPLSPRRRQGAPPTDLFPAVFGQWDSADATATQVVGTTHRRPVRQPWWRGCTPGLPRRRTSTSTSCSSRAVLLSQIPHVLRMARLRVPSDRTGEGGQGKDKDAIRGDHPISGSPDRAREREGPGTRAIEPHLAKVPRRPLFRPRGQRRFKVRPSVRPGRSVASVRSREKRPLKLLATMADRKCGGEP
jgi:hypothetical protein